MLSNTVCALASSAALMPFYAWSRENSVVRSPTGDTFDWAPESTYVRKPPYFEGMPTEPEPVQDITDARTLAVLGDSVLPALPLTIVPLYFELDGSFPNHEANPLEPANIVDLQRMVVERKADIGIAFDGMHTNAAK